MKTTPFPQVDMLTVSKSSRNQRKSILGFAPKIGLSVVDYKRDEEIDSFYISCQNQRDYYRDPYKKLGKNPDFLVQGPCGQRPDPNTAILSQPVRSVLERLPIIYPLVPAPLECMETINLGGTFSRPSCKKYRR